METVNIKKGDIVYVDLDENSIGSEQNGLRYCIVVQNNQGNKYSPTTIIAPITSKIHKKKLPTHYEISDFQMHHLKSESRILFEQIRVIDKKRILRKLNTCISESIINQYLLTSLGI